MADFQPMGWLFYTLTTVVLWAGWSFLGKLALDRTSSVQATIIFGLATAIAGAVAIALGQRTSAWTPAALWVAGLSALSGGIGMVTFYVALQEGKASVVVPIIGLYPAIVAVLAVAFLGERLSVVQYVGIVLAVTGVVLLGVGG